MDGARRAMGVCGGAAGGTRKEDFTYAKSLERKEEPLAWQIQVKNERTLGLQANPKMWASGN
jgi:hypothetical protein